MSLNILKYPHKEDGEEYSMTFKTKNGQVMINATEMARPFGKLVGDFMRLNQTKSFINILKSRYGDSHIAKFEPYKIIKGGNKNVQGTWMCKKLALKFASWLNSEFELWVYDRIEDLLENGYTSIATSRMVNILDHLNKKNQKHQTSLVAHKMYLSEDSKDRGVGKIINYHVNSSLAHTGKKPYEIKKIGLERGLNRTQTKSARETIRNLEPELACAMSLTDNIISSSNNLDIENLNEVAQMSIKHGIPLFREVLKLGNKPKELESKLPTHTT